MKGTSDARTPEESIAAVDETRRADIQRLHELVREVAPELEPTMEFGKPGRVAERYRERLPKANIGKSCVRFKRLADLDENILREMIRESATAGWGIWAPAVAPLEPTRWGGVTAVIQV